MNRSADIARSRETLYRLLVRALLPPDPERFAELASSVAAIDIPDVDGFALGPFWSRLAGHSPADMAATGLDADYARLFASSEAGGLSPPTEAHYRAPADRIAEFVTGLLGEYRDLGFATSGLEEVADHVTTELEVMAFLCDLEAGMWDDGRLPLVSRVIERESRFLSRHLMMWIPRFRRRVRDAQPAPFYRDTVDAVHAFVAQDHDYVRRIRSELTA